MLRFFTLVLLMAFSLSLAADSVSKLQKTEILGKEYYIYEVKKGESVYGIAKKYGWDLKELLRLNPEAGSLKKGDRLYYPTGHVSVVQEIDEPIEIDYSALEPIRHKVKKGETIYSISRQYNMPLDIIYKYNPPTKKGVKIGEVIEIPQNGSAEFYYYNIKSGDSLASVAQTFNTSVDDILKNNAGLTTSNLYPGETIRISLNSNAGKIKTEKFTEERVSQISGDKVSKNESWDEISEKTGVEVDVLKDANKSADDPKENTMINVPVVETVEVEKEITVTDPTTLSSQEIEVIYDSIKGITPDERISENVRMALLMDEPASKKDIEFTRGLLIGLNDFKDKSYKIELKVIDGRNSTGDVLDELDEYEPNIIISTADKVFPLFLADYGNTNNIQIINVFDLKNDLYEDNASIVQILPPSRYFYDRLANRIYKDNKYRSFIAIGEPDESDGMAAELFNLYPEGKNISLEEFGAMEPDIFQPLLLYSYATRKEEISDFLNNVANLSENNPGLDFRVIGRSSWLAHTDDFADQFEEYSVYIPSRVGLDEESPEWKKFAVAYDVMFDGYPIRSIPNFAASGYDMANYFIPLVAENHGDFNHGLNKGRKTGLQNEINLSRVNNWGGFINDISYLLRFRPGGDLERITVR